MLYLYCKALHIIAAISWMAGLLYLPRLFVYHAMVPVGSERDKMLQVMEYKLLRYIMNPAMLVTTACGLWMIHHIGFANYTKWLHIKILMVIGLWGAHGMMSRYRRLFAAGLNQKSHTFFRVLNEVPTLLMIIIVIMAVVKPW